MAKDSSSYPGRPAHDTDETTYAIFGAVEEISDEQVQQMFDVNVFGVMRTIRAVAPHMRQQGGGRIIMSPYQRLYQQYRQVTEAMSQQSPGPEIVSQVIHQAIESARPKARYLAAVPFSGRLILYWRDSVWDVVLRQMFKIASAPA